MEALGCQNLSSEVVDDNLGLSSKEGLSKAEVNFSSTPTMLSPVKNEKTTNSDEKQNSKVDKSVNGEEEVLEKDTNESESVSKKGTSPTIFGQAFRVMKNLFSPEKIISKPTNTINSINQQRSASGSPCNSVYVLNNPDINVTVCENESPVIFQSSSAEKSLKKEHCYLNQFGVVHSSAPLDSHNNTDDSFLTSVSLFEESFQSAVTHLDENGEVLKNDENSVDKSFSLDMPNADNEALNDSQFCLENTLLRNGSFASEGTKSGNISGESKEENGEGLNVTQIINFEKLNNKVTETVLEENSGSPLENKKIEEKGVVDLFLNESFGKFSKINENGKNGEISQETEEENNYTPGGEATEGFSQNKSREVFCEEEGQVLSDEQESLPGDIISTTTIVLSGVDSHESNGFSPAEGADSQKTIWLSSSRKGQDFPEPNVTATPTVILHSLKEENRPLDDGHKESEVDSGVKSQSSLPNISVKGVTKKSPNFKNRKSPRKSPYTGKNFGHEVTNGNVDILQLGSLKGQMELPSDLDFGLPISQESFTVLKASGPNLNRPIICSSGDLSSGILKELSLELSKESENVCRVESEVLVKNKRNEFCNEHSDTCENVNPMRTPKQSTPINRAGDYDKSKSCKTVVSKNESFTILPEGNIKDGNALVGSQAIALDKTLVLSSANTESVDLSPVPCSNGEPLASPNDTGNSSYQKVCDLNRTWCFPSKPPNEINQTFDKKSESPALNELNQTFVTKGESPLPETLNSTFTKKPESIVDVDKNPEPLVVNQTFQEVPEVTDNLSVEINRAFEKKAGNAKELNKTFEKDAEITDANNLNNTKTERERSLGKCVETETLNSQLPAILENVDSTAVKDSSNGSFISTTSSNSSFLCCNSTVMINQGAASSNQGVDGLTDKMRELNFGVSETIDEKSSGTTVSESVEDEIAFSDDKLTNFLKDDKLQCDLDLVQLIQEQFTSNDIEKICSVVDDLSSMKLTSQILKASEEFDKSYHESLSKSPQSEVQPEKIINTLSPQSFDFLSSIRGKPTGRDFSRESLYVKFDPLVQPPTGNSLIDFTKEGEALPANEISPVADNFCEQLLSISPQKQSEDIVPPLTPLSHKKKEDKMERLKELQNEIFFLKSLYAERERMNKAKIDEYESQITKLTGDNVILEEKLKESGERERSLVKKLKEQSQNLHQFKILMEEYVRVTTKLTAELEETKMKSVKQTEVLVSERDSYVTHLQNTEAAFTDVHAKYEKSKKTIESLKTNEAMFRNTIKEQSNVLAELQEKAKGAQEKALKELQKIQEELNEAKENHAQETARLRAQLRKTELKVEALQESLDHKIKENEQLTAICDELIEGKK